MHYKNKNKLQSYCGPSWIESEIYLYQEIGHSLFPKPVTLVVFAVAEIFPQPNISFL